MTAGRNLTLFGYLAYWLSVCAALSPSLQKVIDRANNNDLYTYPTDFTKGIVPKRIHSHNDYWRDIPFYSALSQGAISVEADVWLINGTLYVGHETGALTASRTFQSLYINPILDTIHLQNPSTQFTAGRVTKNGVYDTAPDQTLYLFVDLKTDSDTTWLAVISALAPLQDAGYLTKTDGKTIIYAPVTVIGTGNAPLTYFTPEPASASSPRVVFYDGPLGKLASQNITKVISPVASADFKALVGELKGDGCRYVFNSTQLAAIKAQILEATSRGISARFWDTPGWPIGVRNAIWRALWEEGAGLINVDDLDGAAKLWEQR